MAEVTADTANISAFSNLIKIHYGEQVAPLVLNFTDLMSMVKESGRFDGQFGGESFKFPYETKRHMNVGVRTRGGFLPGHSGHSSGNDKLTTLNAQMAEVTRARQYAGVSFDGLFLQKPNKQYFFKPGLQFAEQLTRTLEDMSQDLQWWLLGDKTGYLGEVVSVSYSGGTGLTTITLKDADDIHTRGIGGTQRFRANQGIQFIEAAHWASSPTASQVDSDYWWIVNDVSDIYDTDASPSITVSGDLSAILAAGDVLVPAGSRLGTSGGSASGGSLYGFEGLYNWIDDGTYSSSLYGITRADYPVLNAKTDLSTTGRQPTWERFQSLMSKIERRIGKKGMSRHVVLSEPSVRDAYVPGAHEPGKVYIQNDKALKAVEGFSDVELVFLGKTRMVPWVCDRDVPYGHAFLLGMEDLEAMWEKKPSVMDEDGLEMRQTTGKDEWTVYFSCYGQFLKAEPYKDALITGLEGTF